MEDILSAMRSMRAMRSRKKSSGEWRARARLSQQMEMYRVSRGFLRPKLVEFLKPPESVSQGLKLLEVLDLQRHHTIEADGSPLFFYSVTMRWSIGFELECIVQDPVFAHLLQSSKGSLC